MLVLLVALGGWTWHAGRAVEPADTGGAPHLPDRFFRDASPWTHEFGGPPGKLVTVFPAPHKSLLRTTLGLVGVTASSGTYGFLRLPTDAALPDQDSAAFALSPDGERLAFWLAGTPSGSPNTVDQGVTITGVATYDTATGAVRRSPIATEHGISPNMLMWSDDRTLVLDYSQLAGGDGSEKSTEGHLATTQVWDAASPALGASSAAIPWFPDSFSTRATDGMLISPGLHRRSWSVADLDRQSHFTFRTDRGADLLLPSPDHRRVVAVPNPNADSGPLVLAAIPSAADGPHPVTRFRTVAAGTKWVRPLAWVDDEHVAVVRKIVVHDPNLGPHVSGRVDLVDVRTGATRRLMADYGPHGTNDSDPWTATDLFGAPVVHATPPPSPWDLRWLLGGTVACVVVAGLYLWGARGRRA